MSKGDGMVKRMRPNEDLIQGLHDWCKAIPDIYRTQIIEVGSWAGESALIFAEYFVEVVCIDDWKAPVPEGEGYTIEDVYRAFLDRVSTRVNIHWMRVPSFDGAKMYSDCSVPVVYLDAMHDEESVHKNILEWLPKVEKGGYIGGHDYGEYFPGVARAVHKFFPPDRVMTFRDCSWLVRVEN